VKARHVNGQAMIFFIVLLPVLLLTAGTIVRSGKTLLVHQRIQNHCDEKVLDAVAEQAKGLERLAKLNTKARTTIDSRRVIDDLLSAGLIELPALPELLAARRTLQMIQGAIAAEQTWITEQALMGSLQKMRKAPPLEDSGKVTETFRPQGILLPHPLPNSLKLHVIPVEGYEGEKGPPLKLDADFDRRQEVHAQIEIKTEKFLDFWAHMPKAKNVLVTCGARIHMNHLEEKWTAQLMPTEVKPSLKLFSE
jgi:hypothetical protein